MVGGIDKMLGALVRPKPARNDQLLKLYWNRAGVKRELKSLKEERFQLLDQLKDQQHQIARAKEQLDGLERLLVNPIAAANAMVYFQLRHLWRVASQRLELYAAELAQQHEARERTMLQEAAIAKRQRRLEAIDASVQSMTDKHRQCKNERLELEQRLTAMNPLVRVFNGPRQRSRIAELVVAESEAAIELDELHQLTEKIRAEPLPELDALSLANRRIINTSLIALAQQLAVHFAGNNLAQLALTASHRGVQEMKFGNRRECDRMVESIRERIADLNGDQHVAELSNQRAAQLARELTYRDDTDSVPGSHVIPAIMPIAQGNASRRDSDIALRINVLADNYWDLETYLR